MQSHLRILITNRKDSFMAEEMRLVATMDSACRVMALANSSQRSLTPPSQPPRIAVPAQFARPTSMTLGQLAQSKPGGVK